MCVHALKLAYAHQIIQQIFRRSYTPDPHFKGEGAREGKRRVGLEEMKWEGKMKGRGGGDGRGGTIVREDWWPLN
jgi:hypothetical protein